MLTPPNYCIQVALSINRATCCFDTSTSRYPARRGWGSVVYFWRTASTNGTFKGMTRHNGPRGFVNWREIPMSLIDWALGAYPSPCDWRADGLPSFAEAALRMAA